MYFFMETSLFTMLQPREVLGEKDLKNFSGSADPPTNNPRHQRDERGQSNAETRPSPWGYPGE